MAWSQHSARNPRASVFIAVSLDGFIAREDGSLDWLEEAEPDPSGDSPSAPELETAGTGGAEPGSEDYGYQAFMDSVDVLVMGRHTYEKVQSFGEWPYGDTQVVVLSSQPVEIPDGFGEVTWSNSPPTTLARELAGEGAKHLYIDGGNTIQRFLAEGLIQQLVITRVPVLLGNGIPLFGPISDSDIHLEHVATRAFDNGFVQSTYLVVNS